ncbi:hypothetical protein MKW98_028169 [Papaver atlanticum]|uniref:Uncharacterized protein n=1 Tax=Papaver atlanticum TaxID=357466 RepID=A0AAD4XLS9_9MAGN|nr:hypothetical protein MKW98_028169 [Papaver atlanticum]
MLCEALPTCLPIFCLEWFRRTIVGSISMMREEPPVDFSKMSKDAPLVEKQRRQAEKRELVEARELGEYLKKNPLDKKSFVSDIKRYSSNTIIYVFTFGYAKLESSNYKEFIKSLTYDNSYKVYFGRKKSLSKIVGTISEEKFNPELKPGDIGYKPKELLPGLHKIGIMLFNYDDAGVLLTDKTKDEVLRKLKEYEECDFVKEGQTPMETVRKSYSLRSLYSLMIVDLVFQKDDCLTLPPLSNARNLYLKLKELSMPVVLSGGNIKLTDTFCVCEDGKRVTENTTEILGLLEKKMFKYVLMPLCCWSASTGETEYFP